MSMIMLAKDASEAAGPALPQLDIATYPSQVFWLVIAFVILYLLLDRVFLPKLGNTIEERNDRIADDHDKAAQFTADAKQAESDYVKALADAKAKASTIAAQTRADIDAEITDLQQSNDAKIASNLSEAEARIQEMQKQAETKIVDAANETTKAMVERLAGSTAVDFDVEQAISNITKS